jgi:hypothetical protein
MENGGGDAGAGTTESVGLLTATSDNVVFQYVLYFTT